MITKEFLEKLGSHDKRIVARAITYVESYPDKAEELLKSIFPKAGAAYRIGITGPPGSGKSTITNQLTKHYRKQNKKVAVIAVDPTSPFTGGALLGDRVRMSDTGSDKEVFIRSMATRGSLGGLSKKAIDAADVLDAAGYDIIIYETVGVGQSELDIVKAADTTVVVLVPESGDAVQAMKAGLMEIADFFAINKCDRPGADQAVNAVKTILSLKDHDEHTWMPAILKVTANNNEGIDLIAGEIERHGNYLNETGKFTQNRQLRMKERVKEIVEGKVTVEIWSTYSTDNVEDAINKAAQGKLSPYQIADNILLNYKEHLKNF